MLTELGTLRVPVMLYACEREREREIKRLRKGNTEQGENEERLVCGRTLCLRERKRDKDGENACKGSYTLFTGQREIDR